VDSDNIGSFAWKFNDNGEISFPGGTIIAGEKLTIYKEEKKNKINGIVVTREKYYIIYQL